MKFIISSIVLSLLVPSAIFAAETTPPASEAAATPCGRSTIPIDKNTKEVRTAKLGEVVWHAAVEAKGLIGALWQLHCGGVVIANNAVLTSASCIDGQFSGMNRVQAGIIDKPEPGWFLEFPGESKPTQSFIESVKTHPNFDKKTKANNLAILRLAMPFDFAKTEGNISNICMPATSIKNASLPEDEPLFIAGWGTGGIVKEIRKQLRIRPTKIVDCPKTLKLNPNEFCVSQQIEDDLEPTTTTTTEATMETTTTIIDDEPVFECEGDMGGSLFTANTDESGSILLGIASRGKNCTTDDPMIYLDVFPYLEWIEKESKPYF